LLETGAHCRASTGGGGADPPPGGQLVSLFTPRCPVTHAETRLARAGRGRAAPLYVRRRASPDAGGTDGTKTSPKNGTRSRTVPLGQNCIARARQQRLGDVQCLGTTHGRRPRKQRQEEEKQPTRRRGSGRFTHAGKTPGAPPMAPRTWVELAPKTLAFCARLVDSLSRWGARRLSGGTGPARRRLRLGPAAAALPPT
jgi:hypothetical protein